MADSGEWSKGGSRMMRHATPAAEQDLPAPPDEDARAAVVRHFSRFVGPARSVFRAVSSDVTPNLEVHVIPPSGGRRAWTLHTVGMSDGEMIVPRGIEVPHRAELMIRLPATWSIDSRAVGETRWDWPMRWLRQLARLPQEFDTWLGPGHTVPNGEPARPLGLGTKQCCLLVMPPPSLPEDERVVETPAGGAIALYALYPLYVDEMELKLREGLPALLDRFEKAGVRDVVDPTRRNVAARAKLFGIF